VRSSSELLRRKGLLMTPFRLGLAAGLVGLPWYPALSPVAGPGRKLKTHTRLVTTTELSRGRINFSDMAPRQPKNAPMPLCSRPSPTNDLGSSVMPLPSTHSW
jgi:hypothetical protein